MDGYVFCHSVFVANWEDMGLNTSHVTNVVDQKELKLFIYVLCVL